MSRGTTSVIRRTFTGLDKETLDTLRTVAQSRHYPARTVLCQQGQIEHTFYIVVEGQVVASQVLDGGEERILAIIGPNDYFGEMGLIDDTPRVASCTTVVPTTVLEVTEEVFDRLVEKSPAIAYAILQRVLATARENDRRAIEALEAKNEALQAAMAELQKAQAQLVEKERLEHEMALAAEVQRSLLPGDLPQYADHAFAAYLEPARQVGGDFYDVIDLDDEHVGLLIADVADKGFHAALFMAVLRTLFLQESKHSLSPAQVALAVHRAMMELADTFVTVFYGVLHRPSGRLTYVRAAHERPFHVRPGQFIEPLSGDGRFLGMVESLQLAEHTVQLQPGDRLVLFSDGATDAVNGDGEQYGNGRLLATVEAHGHLSATGLKSRIVAEVTAWRRDAPAFDDLTLLVVEAKMES